MGVLAEVGWITFDQKSTEHRIAAGAVTVIALASGLFFYAYTYRKWGPFLSNMKLDLHIIQEDFDGVDGDTHGARAGPVSTAQAPLRDTPQEFKAHEGGGLPGRGQEPSVRGVGDDEGRRRVGEAGIGDDMPPPARSGTSRSGSEGAMGRLRRSVGSARWER